MTDGTHAPQAHHDNGRRRAVITADDPDRGFAVRITYDDAGYPTSFARAGAVPEDEDEPLPEGVFHLLIADEDLYGRALRWRATLCGAWVHPRELPSSYFAENELRNPRYCPECVSEAVRWSADAADAESARL